MKIVISSGHGLYVRGASGYLDEVDEARRVVEKTAEYLKALGIQVITFHDDVSKSQNENLQRIVNYHNAQGSHDLDISVHFNAYQTTSKPMGTECLWLTQEALAQIVADKISAAGGFINRGAKYRNDLYFLGNTVAPAILIETCFVDSSADASLYNTYGRAICQAIAEAVSGKELQPERPEDLPPLRPGQPEEPEFPPCCSNITCTVFGGKADPNYSAYDEHFITDTELGCALPDRIEGDRPDVVVENVANGKRVVCDIVDVGPWNTDDPYWQTDSRPQAESGTDEKGRTTNKAGIDLTPGAARAIDLSGKGTVHWKFEDDSAIAAGQPRRPSRDS